MDEPSPILQMQSIPEKLLEVDRSLSQAQHEGVSFLCAALVPSGKLYDPSPDTTPSVSDCFSALKDYRETQPIATSILLHILSFVGCDWLLITQLRQLIHGAQESAADARSTPDDDIHASLSDEASQKLHLRKLLHDVHEDLPKTDQKDLMHLSVWDLNPRRNVNYTSSLFVHFAHLIEQEVITPSNLQRLHHWLNIMGKQTTLNKIDNYCRSAAIPIPKGTRIERYNVYGTSVSPSPALPASPLRESLTMSSPSIQDGYRHHIGNAAPPAADSVDSDQFPHPVEATSWSPHVSTEGLIGGSSSGTVHTDVSKKHERGGLEWSIPRGPVVPDKASPATQGATGLDEHSPAHHDRGKATAVRFSDDAAYIKWSSGGICERFTVTIQDKHEEKFYNVRSNQLVLTKLRPDTCYRVTVSGLSQDGICVWRGTAPIPSNEKPNGIQVTGRTSASLTVEWNCVDLLEVEGYRVQYFAENDSHTQDVSGAGNHTVTLTDLQPGTEYTVQVAPLYETDVVGPYSDSITTATLPPSIQDSTSPRESARESTPLLTDSSGSDISGESPGGSDDTVTSKKPKRKHCICCCVLSTLPLVLLAVSCVIGLLVYNFGILQSVTMRREVRGNDTFALYTADAFKYSKVEINPKGSELVEIFSGEGDCNTIQVSSNPYHYEWHGNASMMSTYELTSGYFGHSSELIFQANVTGQFDLSNCSAAVYLFDNANSYSKFLSDGTTENYVHRACFNLSRNGSGYNYPQSYSIGESIYLFLGLYLPPIGTADHADLAVSGVQSYYNRSELTSRCNISLNNPTCSFALSTKFFVLKTTPVCILGHWESTNTETHNVELDLSSSFWQNLVTVVLLPFCVTFFIVVVAIVFCSFLYLYCR